jgi:hypothetical protein
MADIQLVKQSDISTVATSGSYADLSNKPTIPTQTSQLANNSGFLTTVSSATISDASTVGKLVLTATDAPTARTAIGAGTSNLAIGTTGTTAKAGNYVPGWTEVTGKPTTFTPSAHTHTASQITDFATAVSSNSTVTGKLTATQMVNLDPATATTTDIINALIAAGIMAGA